MKVIKNFCMLSVAVIILLSVFAKPALAANTTDTKFEIDAPIDTFLQIQDRQKTDTSSIFLRIDHMTGAHIRVAAYWSIPDDWGWYDQNLTYYGGTNVPWVRCQRGINYSVQSTIYETYSKGSMAYPCMATLGFQSAIESSDSIDGWWSVDSSRKHQTPIGP